MKFLPIKYIASRLQVISISGGKQKNTWGLAFRKASNSETNNQYKQQTPKLNPTHLRKIQSSTVIPCNSLNMRDYNKNLHLSTSKKGEKKTNTHSACRIPLKAERASCFWDVLRQRSTEWDSSGRPHLGSICSFCLHPSPYISYLNQQKKQAKQLWDPHHNTGSCLRHAELNDIMQAGPWCQRATRHLSQTASFLCGTPLVLEASFRDIS